LLGIAHPEAEMVKVVEASDIGHGASVGIFGLEIIEDDNKVYG
jgi:hypothetical protein